MLRFRRPSSIPLAESAPLADLERAIDQRLRVVKRAPRVQFSPLFAETPPAAKRKRKIVVAVSIAAHVLLVVVVVLMPKHVQSIDDPRLPIEIVLAMEPPKVPEVKLAPAAPKPLPKPAPKARLEQPREEPPPPPVAEAPKPVAKPEPVPEIVKAEPPKPKPEVKVGLLDESPAAPNVVASRTSRSPVVVGAGFDGGTAGGTGTAARSGRVVQAAFEEASTKTKGRSAPATSVKAAAFDAEAAPKKRDAEATRPPSVDDTDVEILTKPKPVYTEEARALHLEGDVVLDVVFEALGTVRVIGVASGLGHGLDEAAAAAAKKIQFVPAKRDGTPVDHAARLRVVFRLA
ncbi:MAG TPA: TonB family protein [Candidatus Polarisedimenticolaceae bacterium]|nr:TonB family protein [Candidatus Polarisedimenticolaceae bacterium]